MQSRIASASAAAARAVAAPAAVEGSWPGEAATHPSSRPCRTCPHRPPVHTCGNCRPRSRASWRLCYWTPPWARSGKRCCRRPPGRWNCSLRSITGRACPPPTHVSKAAMVKVAVVHMDLGSGTGLTPAARPPARSMQFCITYLTRENETTKAKLSAGDTVGQGLATQ